MNSTKDFSGIKPLEKRVYLSSPTMHGDEMKYIQEAYDTNWMTTAGTNITEIEKQAAAYVGCKYAVALSAGTAALHLATKLAGEKLYGMAKPNQGTLQGHKVFCSDMTFAASINPVAYEDGEAVFIDTERDTWNMDPVALEKAFELYPDVKFYFLMGGDSILQFHTWVRPEEIVANASIVYTERAGERKAEEVLPLLRERFPQGEFLRVELPNLEISSTEIRRRLAEGISCRYMLPEAVYRFIMENGLYSGGSN